MTDNSSLERFRDVRTAVVYKAGVRAATLKRDRGGTVFRYETEYLDRGGPAVATTLPLTDQPIRHEAGAVPPFFAGLLPEGRRLSGLRRAVKTSADDELSLLLAVGMDTIGDVQIVPEGEDLVEAQAMLQVQSEWSEVRFADVLGEAGVDRVGIPGVQDKASARMISVPVAKAGRRYILKVDPPEFPHVVEDEAFFLDLARKARLDCTEATVVKDADDKLGLLVTRFDRWANAEGDSGALACEDACQVLGLWPADKYNVSCEEAVSALADRCAARSVAARAFFRQVCFAWLTGNGDLHAKNLAILATPEGEWRAAPAYDLPSTVPYGDTSFALALQGVRTGISRRRFVDFGAAIGLSDKVCGKALDEVLERTSGLDDGLSELPFPQGTLADLGAELRFRRRQLTG